jgi:hypothetical protein
LPWRQAAGGGEGLHAHIFADHVAGAFDRNPVEIGQHIGRHVAQRFHLRILLFDGLQNRAALTHALAIDRSSELVLDHRIDRDDRYVAGQRHGLVFETAPGDFGNV